MYGASDVGTCVKCGQRGRYIMGICFNELEGTPFVCSQCVFEHLTATIVVTVPGMRPAWNTGFSPDGKLPGD